MLTSLALLLAAPLQLTADGVDARPVPEFIVGLRPGITGQDVACNGLTVAQENLPAGRALLQFPGQPTEAQYAQALASLSSDARLNFAEPNRRASAVESDACGSSTPSSQSCTIAFFDGNPDSIRYYDQPALAAIDVQPVWDMLGTFMVVVAVIDTGIDPGHEVLADQIYDLGWDFVTNMPAGLDLPDGIDNDGDGSIDEAYGHGTHVAGTIALINPNARLLPLRVLDSDGNGTAWHVAEAIEYATMAGAHYINLSLGMHQRSHAVARAIHFAHENGVEVFASAGNTGAQHVLFPARHDKTIAVSATDNEDLLAVFSAYGEAVDICAPGVDIYGPMPENRYAWWSGCSMATGIATGAASLLYAVHMDVPEEASEALVDLALDIDSQNPASAGLLGEGRIDVLSAALDLLSD